jgi:hypothetical protein
MRVEMRSTRLYLTLIPIWRIWLGGRNKKVRDHSYGGGNPGIDPRDAGTLTA